MKIVVLAAMTHFVVSFYALSGAACNAATGQSHTIGMTIITGRLVTPSAPVRARTQEVQNKLSTQRRHCPLRKLSTRQ